MSGVVEVGVFAAVVAVIVVVAIRVGMLVAPRLDRVTQPPEEDDGGDHD